MLVSVSNFGDYFATKIRFHNFSNDFKLFNTYYAFVVLFNLALLYHKQQISTQCLIDFKSASYQSAWSKLLDYFKVSLNPYYFDLEFNLVLALTIYSYFEAIHFSLQVYLVSLHRFSKELCLYLC